MRKSDDQGCGCSKTRRRWQVLRALLVLAGLSLMAYMPLKALTQYDKLSDIYGPWFLQGMVVAVAGTLFAYRPGFAARLPLVVRAAVAVSALLWLRTGLACTPHLITTIQASLGPGLVAWFHMSTQHVFLSLGVVAFAIVPKALAERMGFARRGTNGALATAGGLGAEEEPVIDPALS